MVAHTGWSTNRHYWHKGISWVVSFNRGQSDIELWIFNWVSQVALLICVASDHLLPTLIYSIFCGVVGTNCEFNGHCPQTPPPPISLLMILFSSWACSKQTEYIVIRNISHDLEPKYDTKEWQLFAWEISSGIVIIASDHKKLIISNSEFESCILASQHATLLSKFWWFFLQKSSDHPSP